MKIFRSRPAAALAMAAALSLTATPAFARGWGGWGGHRHHDRIDGGDIFAGLLVIGGIAAIASAASKNSRDRREADYRYPDSRPPAPDTYREPPADYADSRDRGDYGARSDADLNGAVDSCVAEVERDNRQVDAVDRVNREGDGWRVEGQMRNGREFSCLVDRGGRIRSATVDGSGV